MMSRMDMRNSVWIFSSTAPSAPACVPLSADPINRENKEAVYPLISEADMQLNRPQHSSLHTPLSRPNQARE